MKNNVKTNDFCKNIHPWLVVMVVVGTRTKLSCIVKLCPASAITTTISEHQHSVLVLCSAPSVSQSVFTITEKAPTG